MRTSEEMSAAESSNDRKERRRHSPWTLEEIEALVHGVEEVGIGKWKQILKSKVIQPYRSEVDLKDKWRNLTKVAFSKTMVMRGIKIPPELFARVKRVADAEKASM
ncbi:hypothetical protein CYMTET_13873 [Cymbomonas tetramitiformis]|uniref:Uncharacterized protein n=1 Tax=Cymbomonas tetramitiformis TaxID=36881 RepID=A0AAE0GHK3_9CHLO|nr:hypothetical protein CYMTET_13873 [Cymbomonas tetramitiformis]